MPFNNSWHWEIYSLDNPFCNFPIESPFCASESTKSNNLTLWPSLDCWVFTRFYTQIARIIRAILTLATPRFFFWYAQIDAPIYLFKTNKKVHLTFNFELSYLVKEKGVGKSKCKYRHFHPIRDRIFLFIRNKVCALTETKKKIFFTVNLTELPWFWDPYAGKLITLPCLGCERNFSSKKYTGKGRKKYSKFDKDNGIENDDQNDKSISYTYNIIVPAVVSLVLLYFWCRSLSHYSAYRNLSISSAHFCVLLLFFESSLVAQKKVTVAMVWCC